jgi:hypothetical protein
VAPDMIRLPESCFRTAQSSFDCAASMEIWLQLHADNSGRNE